MSCKLKMNDLEGLHRPMQEKILSAISQILDRSDFINGEAVDHFLDQLGQFTGAAYAIGCGNGTDALQLALMALDLPPRSEVIVPVFNYVSAAETVALLGYTPVFADAERDTFNLDPAALPSLMNLNTTALIAAHLFGQCADMGRILALGKTHKLQVIEDNAQSLGAACLSPDGALALGGTLGQVGATSFFPTKMLGALGDGGAVFTQDEKLARRIMQTARHGQGNKYEFLRVGINSRLDSLQAAVLGVKLPYLAGHIRARQQVARWYDEQLDGLDGVFIPLITPGNTHVYNHYTIRVAGGLRDRLREYLEKHQVPSQVYYGLPLHLQPAYRHLGYQKGDFPVAEDLCGSVLSLPMHPLLEAGQVAYIGEKVRNFFLNQSRQA